LITDGTLIITVSFLNIIIRDVTFIIQTVMIAICLSVFEHYIRMPLRFPENEFFYHMSVLSETGARHHDKLTAVVTTLYNL